jgi:hypothetical protein
MVVDTRNMAVIQTRNRTDLVAKSQPEPGLFGPLVHQDFNGNRRPTDPVLARPDLAHAALGDAPFQHEWTQWNHRWGTSTCSLG